MIMGTHIVGYEDASYMDKLGYYSHLCKDFKIVLRGENPRRFQVRSKQVGQRALRRRGVRVAY